MTNKAVQLANKSLQNAKWESIKLRHENHKPKSIKKVWAFLRKEITTTMVKTNSNKKIKIDAQNVPIEPNHFLNIRTIPQWRGNSIAGKMNTPIFIKRELLSSNKNLYHKNHPEVIQKNVKLGKNWENINVNV